MKQVLKQAEEWDLVSRWRKKRIITRNAGVWKRVKRALNKRHRQDSKLELSQH